MKSNNFKDILNVVKQEHISFDHIDLKTKRMINLSRTSQFSLPIISSSVLTAMLVIISGLTIMNMYQDHQDQIALQNLEAQKLANVLDTDYIYTMLVNSYEE